MTPAQSTTLRAEKISSEEFWKAQSDISIVGAIILDGEINTQSATLHIEGSGEAIIKAKSLAHLKKLGGFAVLESYR